MNIKSISIFLVIFFLTMVTVSATNENITSDETLLMTNENNEDLTATYHENTSSDNTNDNIISISNDENVSLANTNNVSLIAEHSENVSSNNNDNVLSISNDESFVLSKSNELPVAVSVNSKLSTSTEQPKLSTPINQEDEKLTSIYDKVYSRKEWRTVGILSIVLKYKWSKSVMNKVVKQRTKLGIKREKIIIKKFTRKGWTYSRVYYTSHYGKTAARFNYYLQFYKTVYFNGYGEILAIL